MAENTRMKEIQAEQKKASEFMEEAKGKFARMESLFEIVLQSLDELKRDKNQAGSGSTSMHEPSATHEHSANPTVHTFTTVTGRQMKLDFPRFDGKDALDWIFRAERFFKYYEIQESQRLIIAAIHFDGEVLPWFQMLERSHRVPIWNALVQAIEEQFGPSQFDSARGQLFKLTHQGPLEDYNNKFIALSNRTQEIPEAALLDCYLGGLKPELKKDVLVQRPTIVHKAMALARLFHDATVFGFTPSKTKTTSGAGRNSTRNFSASSTGTSTNYTGGKANLPPLLPTPNMPPIKKITPAEMQIRREKGLCYTCDEKFSPSHRCPNKQLMMLQSEEEAHEDSKYMVGEEQGEAEVTLHHLSLYALRGTHGPATIRFNGSILGTNMQILLDGGSSDTFIHPRMVHHLKLPIEIAKEIRVLGGFGRILRTNETVVQVPVQICGHTLAITMYVLLVVGVDMIMGADWLETLGPHVADYSSSTIKFLENGSFVTLKGFRGPPVIQAQLHHLTRICSMDSIAECFMLKPVHATATTSESTIPDDLNEVLEQFKTIFDKPNGLPPDRGHKHRIELLPGVKPIKVRPYRYSVSQKAEIERLVTELLDEGLIQHSHSPFSAPVILVKKKDGTWRFCVDYRALNNATVKDAFPMPIVDELLDELHGSAIYSKLDLRSGYHQILMHEEDIEKTAFRTHQGLYEWKVMPFGLTNAPATFQALMNSIFQPFLRQFVLIFFDDILVYSNSWEQHLAHLREVLATLHKHRLFEKRSKCAFGQRRIEYLGHIVSARGVEMDPSKVQAVQDWPTPTTVSQLRGFLGLSGYYRRFIQGYAQLAGPLTQLLTKDGFHWNSEAHEAFSKLKQALVQAPLLALPDFAEPFVLETDASGIGIGAILSQRNHPIAYFSKKLSPRRQAQSTYVRELYAITEAVAKFRHYLFSHTFVIRTDHASLKHIGEQTIQTPEQEACLPKLLGYRFTIEYKPGKQNQAADALSRATCMTLVSIQDELMNEIFRRAVTSPALQTIRS
ncbi:uncharacterized protein LOC114714818 [Neltuma alba]|uniref:uncharacterized protein LOC114714818 n=1 Tax=Neltuma alba TaxID=207710 RepID=UPI0010A41901|nr:uncharacterized protein LOC114714818 [Prosopis alba]